MRIEDSGDEFTVAHDFAPKEREILVEGGLLHWLSEHGEQVGEAAATTRRRPASRASRRRKSKE